jgi:hypothetical protein
VGRLLQLRSAAALAAVALLAGSTEAAASERQVPEYGPLPPWSLPAHVPDRILSGSPARASAAGTVAAAGRRFYRTADGHQVEVAVSSSYPSDAAADQAIVDFLASRSHGAELGSLRLFVGMPGEVSSLCGGEGAVACYSPGEQRMYVPGQDSGGVPMEYAITHEYGHHVAAWRSNSPWDALDWGPKHWASQVRVCRHVERRLLFPGDQGRHYLDDPGEGFADGYAHLHYPRTDWQYNPLMAPGPAVLRAIRRDVERPWSGPRTLTFRGHGKGVFRVRLRLDGDVAVRLVARRASRHGLEVRSGGVVVRRTLRGGSGLGISWCRRERRELVTFAVRRRSGGGPFELKVRYPG